MNHYVRKAVENRLWDCKLGLKRTEDARKEPGGIYLNRPWHLRATDRLKQEISSLEAVLLEWDLEDVDE